MNILIDMNLSPEWCQVFASIGWKAYHWSTIGDLRAADHTLMQWALEHDCIVFTHDLDFGALLAATNHLARALFRYVPRMSCPQLSVAS